MWLDIGHGTKAIWRACSTAGRFIHILGYGVDYSFALQNSLLEKFYNAKDRHARSFSIVRNQLLLWNQWARFSIPLFGQLLCNRIMRIQ